MRYPAGLRARGRSSAAAAVLAFAVCFVALSASPARAIELHSFIDDHCRVTTGVLVRVDETSVQFIGLDGRYAALPVDSVRSLAIHKVLENPIEHITVDAPLAALAREVRIGDGASATFVGWPVGFYDQLVIFFDTQGRSHVLEPQDIRSLRPARSLPGTIAPATFAKVALDFPPELFLCPLPRAEAAVRPSRVLGDRIKVDDYLVKLRDRYVALDSFEERTHVYPRPFVFDPTTRLGLSYFSGPTGAFVKYVPLYFQWSSGRPYRFQSKSTVGVAVSSWLPIVQPTLSFQSDVKSHFFTATFVGHLPSLPAGNAAFREEEAFFPQGKTPAVDELYNYLVLMGGDWASFSVSGGVMYRNVRVAFAEHQRREISADAMSPIGRLMWIGQHARVRAMYFRTRQERRLDEGWRLIEGGMAMPGPIPTSARYALSLDTVRAGVDLDLPYDLSVSADQIVTIGSYRETGAATIDIVHALSSLAVSAQFSRYVATKGYLNILHRRYDIDRDSAGPAEIIEGSTSRTTYQLGGALEFLF